jgi:hypothetical protein
MKCVVVPSLYRLLPYLTHKRSIKEVNFNIIYPDVYAGECLETCIFFFNKFWYILIKFSRLTERSTSINNVFYIQDSHLIITCNHSFQTRSGPRSRFQVLTRSSGSIFLKIKMASKSTGCNWIFDRIAGSHRVFSSSIFSSTRPDSSFESRVDPPGRVLKLCLKHLPSSLKLPWAILHPIHF